MAADRECVLVGDVACRGFYFQGHPRLNFAPGLVCQFHEGLKQLAHVNRTGFTAGKFRIQPRRIGDVRNQPIQPLDVILDDGDQAVALFRRAGIFDGFNGRAQGSQRVLQFMRNVCCKSLDGLDAVVQGTGHFPQGAGQVPDLVTAG